MKKTPINFDSETENPDLFGVKDVSPEELREKSSQVHLVDVRQPEEFIGELGHVEGSRLIPLGTLPHQCSELPKDEPIVLICRSGARSAQAAAFLQENGFAHVFNLKGGMLRWNDLGYQTETE